MCSEDSTIFFSFGWQGEKGEGLEKIDLEYSMMPGGGEGRNCDGIMLASSIEFQLRTQGMVDSREF